MDVKSPKIKKKLIPHLYQIARAKGILVDELVNEWLAEKIIEAEEEIIFLRKRKKLRGSKAQIKHKCP